MCRILCGVASFFLYAESHGSLSDFPLLTPSAGSRVIGGDRPRFFSQSAETRLQKTVIGIAILHYNLSYIRLDASLNFLF